MNISKLYTNLRETVLTLAKKDKSKKLAATENGLVAVMMEMTSKEGMAFVMALVDGGASIYFSNGGGISGTKGHALLVQQVKNNLDSFEEHKNLLAPLEKSDHPGLDSVKFYYIGQQETLVAEATMADLESRASDLWPLYWQGHELIAVIRMAEAHASESSQANGSRNHSKINF